MRPHKGFLLLSAMSLSIAGCGGDDDGGPDPTAMRADLAASITREVIVPAIGDFATKAAALEAATEAHASAPTDATREAAQTAFLDAMLAWQVIEVMQVGPLGPASEGRGGRDLRDEVYPWPVVAPCRVDQLVADTPPADVDALAAEPVNVRGLSAIEQLLFAPSDAPTCETARASWTAVGATEIDARRARYAYFSAQIVRRNADTIVTAFDPAGEDFAGELARAGRGSAIFPSGQSALNTISDAFFYVDAETKDMKLAEPAGISMRCTTDVCPELAESLYAHRSREYIAQNLRGFLSIYRGGEGRGFDDLLRENGADAAATTVEGDATAAIDAVESLPGSLEMAITTDRARVVAAYDAVKKLFDDVKTEMITVLDLELPARADGDND